MRIPSKYLLAIALAWSATWCPSGGASVVMTGTRVVYPGDAREKTLQFSNEDDHPNLVQVWVGERSGTMASHGDEAPFVVMPSVFRMEPRTGQRVRLVFTGDALPRDRESVFHLGFSQVPALKAKDRDANRLVLMFSHRLKLFYRPAGLPGGPADLPARLRFTRHVEAGGPQVVVDNPTAYHAVVRRASVEAANARCLLVAGVMVAPRSQARWRVPPGCDAGAADARLRLVLVNDFGADDARDVALR